jgi:hypothetical protein
MNKTDNLELIARPDTSNDPVQLGLPLPVKSEKPLTELQKKQQVNFETICAHARRDTAVFLAVVQQMFPEAGYTKLRDVTIAHLKEARPFYVAHPDYDPRPAQVLYPELNIDYVAQAIKEFGHRVPTKPRKQREYKPWSWERRVQTAAKKMLQRFHKKWSIGELWIDQAQAKILENPWRYGCCPLPSEGSCIIPDPDSILSKRAAMTRELELREQGSRY